MTASTYRSLYHKPAYGRLNFNKADGWCTRTADRNDDEWLQVDLGQLFELCGVAIQGDSQYIGDDEWVTEFKMFYSQDGNTWTTYKFENGSAVVRFREEVH